MVKLIPPFAGDEVKSGAEKKMFEVLKNLNMKNAYVLHSLGLPKHRSKIYGEIDFVVVCERGVACLEIKGGRIECKDGRWIFTDRYGVERTKMEGPFAQVIGNMFSLKTLLKQRFSSIPQMKNLLVASGVVFPDIEFRSRSQEIIDEIIYDRRTEDITAYLHRVFDYWEGREHRSTMKLPPYAIEEIVAYLRGEFSFIPSLLDRLDTVDRSLVRLTAEQARLLDALRFNERLMIEGDAGTGKTFLALDFSVKKAEEGSRVLYLTFNKNLAKHISDRVGTRKDLKVVNIHALFGEYVEVDAERVKKNAKTYFSNILPEECFLHLSSLGKEELEDLRFDLIVMDEGQDIIRPSYIYVLDLLLKGGFEKGRWAIFYDEKQNIYNSEYQEGAELLSSFPHTKFQLFINCRNTVQIGTYASEASGVDLKEFIRENGEEVNKRSYSDENDYITKIKQVLKELRKENIPMTDITFLAPRKYTNTALYRGGIKVEEIGVDIRGENLPKFSTIQGYKGLDSKIIILCELDSIYDKEYSKYIYISVTRARTLLYVLASEEFWEKHEEMAK